MKFHWGTGIFIFLGLFILALAFVLYKSKQVDHSLVLNNYYEEDLKYQNKYEKIDNYYNLKRKINLVYTPGDSIIQLIFPTYKKDAHIGKVTCYRPNDSSEDKTYDFKLEKDSVFAIPAHNLSAGKWTLKLDWAWGKMLLYNERTLIIQ